MSWLRPYWVIKFYEGFGSKLQPAADKIKALEWSSDVKEALQMLSDALPNKIAVGFINYITVVYKKLGPKQAEEWVKKILDIITNFSFKRK